MRADTTPYLLAILLLAICTGGCTERFGLSYKLQSFQVVFSSGDDAVAQGSDENPLPFVSGISCTSDGDCKASERCVDERCNHCYRLDINAVGTDGEPFLFTGTLRADATPGFIAPSTRRIEMVKGTVQGAEVCINRATGRSNLWVEDAGFVPKPDSVQYGQCNDGLDNDDNGHIDQLDPGCTGIDDNLEAPFSLSTGLSPTLHYGTPTIRQAQQTNRVQDSPMQGQQVRFDQGAMVVTNVVANGFYVTDMADMSLDRPFHSLFVFTFSAPVGVELNDIVCWMSGGIEEHVGHTQVIFPSFYTHPQDVDLVPSACERDINAYLGAFARIPSVDANDLTDELVVETSGTNIQDNSELLESHESSLIRLRDIEVPTRLIACDRDKNGIISDGDEKNCRNQCQNDDLCTDLEGFFEYRQWTGRVAERKKMGFSVAVAARFTPLAIDYLGQDDQQDLCARETTPLGFLQYRCPSRRVESITGSLRHIYLCGKSTGKNSCGLQFWVLDPRFDGDVILPSELDQDGDGVTPGAGDCNDNHPHIGPNADEVPGNGVDDDCDGETL